MRKMYSQRKLITFCLIAAACILFILKIPVILANPFFVGDSGYRMDHAYQTIVLMGNRAWLPFLQAQIHVLYKLGVPFWAFKLIPSFYFFIAVVFLGLLFIRMLGKNYGGLLLALFIMICFALQQQIMFLSINLYQEILEVALLYLLLYLGCLELRKNALLLAVASIALLTRDSFFIYLFVLTALNFKKIISSKKYIFSFLWLWSIPLCWLGAYQAYFIIKHKHVSWHPMINENPAITSGHFHSVLSLKSAFISSGIHFLAIPVILAVIFIAVSSKAKKGEILQSDSFAVRFKVFSLVSLACIYSLIVVFDPWQCSYGHPRMSLPILSHMFIWIGIFYKEAIVCPKAPRIIVRAALISALLFTSYGQITKWFIKDNRAEEALRFYNAMDNLKKKYSGGNPPKVCIVGPNYWDSIEVLIAPTLYMNRTLVNNMDACSPGDYDIIITAPEFRFNDARFLPYGISKTDKIPYLVYFRTKTN